MDGVSAIGGAPVGGMPIRPQLPAVTGTGEALPASKPAAASSTAPGQSVLSSSATSINATSESFFGTSSPVLADEQLMGMVVLLLTLQYLMSEDDEEKKGLLALMMALSQQQQASNGAETFMYNASSLSIESSQVQAVSTEGALGAYAGAANSPQQVPAADPGVGGGLDVVA